MKNENEKQQDKGSANLPRLAIKGHLVRNETQIENVGRSFEFRAFQFAVYMRRSVWCIASYDGIIIPDGNLSNNDKFWRVKFDLSRSS